MNNPCDMHSWSSQGRTKRPAKVYKPGFAGPIKVCNYSGTCVIRPPSGLVKIGLILQVVLLDRSAITNVNAYGLFKSGLHRQVVLLERWSFRQVPLYI